MASARTRCPYCRSYADAEKYDRQSEVSHTQHRPWGNVGQGVPLAHDKRPMYLAVLELLRRFPAPGKTLFDIGCSCGGFIEEARREGYAASGMDIVPESVEYCRQQGFACHVGASIGELEIADGVLDIITVLDCNYYWPDQTRELRAIWAKLKPDGLLAMRVVDKSWLVGAGRAMQRIAPRMSDKITARALNDHRVSIPVRSLLGVLRQEKFSVLRASPAGALQGDHASFAVKAAFVIGRVLWFVSGLYLAPGCLIVARKQTS